MFDLKKTILQTACSAHGPKSKKWKSYDSNTIKSGQQTQKLLGPWAEARDQKIKSSNYRRGKIWFIRAVARSKILEGRLTNKSQNYWGEGPVYWTCTRFWYPTKLWIFFFSCRWTNQFGHLRKTHCVWSFTLRNWNFHEKHTTYKLVQFCLKIYGCVS